MAESSSSTTSAETEDVGMQEFLNLLVTKIESLNVKVKNQEDLLLNNPTETLSNDSGESATDALERERARLMDAILKEVNEANLIEPASLRVQVVDELCTALITELEEMEEILKKSVKELQANEKEYKAITMQISVLKKTQAKREVEGEMKEDVEHDKKNVALKRLFHQHKNMVGDLIENLFGSHEEKVKLILGDLTTRFLKPEMDAYVEIDGDVESIPVIWMLHEHGLVVRHPYENNKIRLFATST